MRTFKLTIITPDKILFDGDAEQIIARTTEGDVGILAGHENYVANLPAGVLKLTTADGIKFAAIADGIIKVNYNKDVKIIVSAAEWSGDIDLLRANRAKDDAMDKMKSAKTHSEMSRAELRLKRALNRINASSLK